MGRHIESPQFVHSVHRQIVIFGIGLDSIWQETLIAWRDMLNWPVVAWLWPKQRIRLVLPDSGVAMCHGPASAVWRDSKHTSQLNSKSLAAVVVPEDIVLRRSIDLPNLQSIELDAAVSMYAHSLSPYKPEETVWVFYSDMQSGGGRRFQIALMSRRLISAHVDKLRLKGDVVNPEVWVKQDLLASDRYIVVPGYGEDRRKRQELLGRSFSAALFLTVISLLILIAGTPTYKLYQRYIIANQSLASLQQKAVPGLKERDAATLASGQLASLAALIDSSPPPLRVLALVTQAMPDDTSLTGLRIQGAKVSISGQTSNAAALMRQLGTMPELRDVIAPAPATRPLGAPKESFGIEFLVLAASSEKLK